MSETKVRAALAAALKTDQQNTFLCLGRLDGRPVMLVRRTNSTNANNVSALGCSLLALSETFAKEAVEGEADYSLVSTRAGSLVTVRVRLEPEDFVLSLGTDGSNTIGAALRAGLDCAKALSELTAKIGLDRPSTAAR